MPPEFGIGKGQPANEHDHMCRRRLNVGGREHSLLLERHQIDSNDVAVREVSSDVECPSDEIVVM